MTDPPKYERPLCALCGVNQRRTGRPTCSACGAALVEAQYERLRAQHAGDTRDIRPPPPPVPTAAPVPPSTSCPTCGPASWVDISGSGD